MLKQTLIALTGAAAIGISATGAASAATIVYEQEYDPNNIGAPFAEDPFEVRDNFVLDNDSNVDELTIWGGYWVDGVVPDPANYLVSFYTDNSFSTSVFSETLTAMSITDTGFDHNNIPGANILEIVMDLGNSVELLGGQEYWLGIQAINPLPNRFFVQEALAEAGDGQYYQSSSIRSGQDLAFRLSLSETESVPEPASLLGLVAVGAIAAGGALKKKAAA